MGEGTEHPVAAYRTIRQSDELLTRRVNYFLSESRGFIGRSVHHRTLAVPRGKERVSRTYGGGSAPTSPIIRSDGRIESASQTELGPSD